MKTDIKWIKMQIKDEKKAAKDYSKHKLGNIAKDERKHRRILIAKLKRELRKRK